ncbi:MAG: response regulator transcription factor [Anaerolinea sp.]|nr:response regulator transcription factor [Anaerolinea sp.]
MTTHILIADGSSLTVVGAETLLKERADTIIKKAENADELIRLARENQPDIILLGDRFDPLFDTLALVEHLIHAAPAGRVIVMGTTSDGLVIRDLFTMGMCGYLAEGDDLSSCLLTALDTVLLERPYLSPTANAEYLITLQASQRHWQLDPEARAVLRLLASGCTAREIAYRLNLKLRRVYWVTEKMRFRFGATTNEHLINRANVEGFVGFPD